MSRKFYLTTPIYYVNDQPHIGHTYTTVVADVLARFHRMNGQEVHFLTGTDEHGQKIERAAAAKGMKPIELADRVVERFRELWQRFGIGYDDFIRTTEKRHRVGVERLFKKIVAKGDVDGMYHEYLRALTETPAVGLALHKRQRKSFESEFYRFVTLYRESGG